MASFDLLAKFGADTSGFAKGVNEVKNQMSGISESSEGLSKKISGAFMGAGKAMTAGLTLPIVGLATASVKIGMDFESAMSKVSALSGATGNDLEQLENIAREMGSTTKFSATESADALGMLALAGWDTNEMTAGLEPTLKLAGAAGLELDEAAQYVTQSIGQFGLKASDATRVTDVLAKAQASSMTDVQGLGSALEVAGVGANSMGYSLEDTTSALAVFANKGLVGSKAGTTLNSVFKEMKDKADDGKIAINGTSIELENADGTYRDFTDILGDMNSATEGLTDVERDSALMKVFGSKAMAGLNILTGEGTDEMIKYTDELNNADGSASDMYDTMQDNLMGTLENLKSALEEVAISLSKTLIPMIEKVVGFIQKWVNKFNDLSDGTKEIIVKVALVVAAIGPLLMLIGAMIPGIMGVVSAIAFLFSPIGMTIALIAGLIAIGVDLYKNWDDIKAEATVIWNSIKDYFFEVLESIKDHFKEVWTRTKEDAMEIWNGISEFFITIMTKIADNIKEKWDKTKEDAMAIWNAIGDFFTETIPKLVEDIITWFTELPPRLQEKWNEIQEAVSVWATDMWEKAKEMASNFMINIFEFFDKLPDRLGMIIGMVLGTIATWAVDMWNKAKETGSNFLNAIVEFFTQLPSRVHGFITDVWERVSTWAINMWTKASELGSKFLNAIVEYFSQLPSRVYGFVTDVWNKVSTWASNMWSKAKETGRNFLNAIVSYLTQLPSRIQGFVSSAYNRVVTWASQMWSKAKETGRNFINGVTDYVRQLPGKIMTFLTNIITKVVTWGRNLGNKGRQGAQGLVTKTTNKAKELPGKMLKVGTDLVKGLWQGIVNVKDWVQGKIGGFMDGVVAGVKKTFKSKSPSKVFAQIGEDLDNGLVMGVEDEQKSVFKAMDKMTKGVIDRGQVDGGVDIQANMLPVNLADNIKQVMNGTAQLNTGDMNSRVMHEVSGNESKKPAEIKLRLGNREYRAFATDILDFQSGEIDFEEIYGI